MVGRHPDVGSGERTLRVGCVGVQRNKRLSRQADLFSLALPCQLEPHHLDQEQARQPLAGGRDFAYASLCVGKI